LTKEKFKVLDTNLFLSDPNTLSSFGSKREDETNTVIIPIEVLAELDKFKSEMGTERGYNARETLRKIHELKRDKGGTLYSGIQVSPTHIIRSSLFITEPSGLELICGLDPQKPDTRILSLVNMLKKAGKDVEFVSNDTSLLDIADAFGIDANPCHDMEGDIRRLDQCYKGWIKLDNPALIAQYERKPKDFKISAGELGIKDPQPNMYAVLRETKKPVIFRYDPKEKLFTPPHSYIYNFRSNKVEPKNAFQMMYMDMLKNPEVELVFAIGVAGTSKTFLSVEAALVQAIRNIDGKNPSELPYARVFITRPRAISSDESDLGFLPGALKEKVDPWFGPIYDQLYQLFETYKFDSDERAHIMGDEDSVMDGAKGSDMVQNRKIHIFDTLYKRGRSLTDAFWIIDDAQNLTKTQLYDLGTRAASNCKLVLNGDPTQCDIKGEGALMNSLVRANEAFKGYEHSATVWFPDEFSVRSPLASAFIKYLGNRKG